MYEFMIDSRFAVFFKSSFEILLVTKPFVFIEDLRNPIHGIGIRNGIFGPANNCSPIAREIDSNLFTHGCSSPFFQVFQAPLLYEHLLRAKSNS